MAKSAMLIYDAECPMCRAARAWLEVSVNNGALGFVPCQDPLRASVAPSLTTEQCMEAMQLVLPDGNILAGDTAAPYLLRLTRKWYWAGWLISLPGMRWLSYPAYTFIARHRLSISALLFREKAPSCHQDACDLKDPRA